MKTKTNLITKLGIVAGLAGAIYFASPAFARADYSFSQASLLSQKEKNPFLTSEYDELERKSLIPEADFSFFDLKNPEKKPNTFVSYQKMLLEISQKDEIGYHDIKKLRNYLAKVEVYSSEGEETNRDNQLNAVLSEIEQKIVNYGKSISEGKKPEKEIDIRDFAFYSMMKNSSDKKINNKEAKGEENEIKKENEVFEKLFRKQKKSQLEVYDSYLNLADEWRNKDFVRENKYWSASFISEASYNKSKIEKSNGFFSAYGTKIIPIADEFPAKIKFPQIPLLACQIIGLVFPIIRNLGLKYYLRKEQAGSTEYFISGVAGLLNGYFGMTMLDSLHPLVFPIRMFATPLIQPILKKTKFFERRMP